MIMGTKMYGLVTFDWKGRNWKEGRWGQRLSTCCIHAALVFCESCLWRCGCRAITQCCYGEKQLCKQLPVSRASQTKKACLVALGGTQQGSRNRGYSAPVTARAVWFQEIRISVKMQFWGGEMKRQDILFLFACLYTSAGSLCGFFSFEWNNLSISSKSSALDTWKG